MQTPLCDLLRIRHPVVLAGMAGGPSTPELVAAVTEAGGLGTFGIHGMSREAVDGAVRHARRLTAGPLGVNVLLAPPAPTDADPAGLARVLDPIREELGLPTERAPAPPSATVEELLHTALAAGADVICTGLGDPAPVMEIARSAGAPVLAMVATVDDARSAAASGADVIVAQGGEAGGHRSNFRVGPDGRVPLVGTMALVPQVVDAVDVPVVAAGGIMDGRGLAAALALGAQGAQFGSRFLLARESGVGAGYRERLRAARDVDSEIITAFSGRPARGLRNALLETMEAAGAPSLGWGRQAAAWSDIRAAGARSDSGEHTTLWAGQAAAMGTTDLGAADIVAEIVRDAREIIKRLGR